MSQPHRRRDRIPTSAELEERGAAAAQDGGRRPGVFKRLLRGGRLRVSEDVAARKHVGGQPRFGLQGSAHDALSATAAPAEVEEHRPVATRHPRPTPPQVEQPRPSGRRIRIEDSVKEQRGQGRR